MYQSQPLHSSAFTIITQDSKGYAFQNTHKGSAPDHARGPPAHHWFFCYLLFYIFSCSSKYFKRLELKQDNKARITHCQKEDFSGLSHDTNGSPVPAFSKLFRKILGRLLILGTTQERKRILETFQEEHRKNLRKEIRKALTLSQERKNNVVSEVNKDGCFSFYCVNVTSAQNSIIS